MNVNDRLNNLEGKFPIQNFDILDETISVHKITDLYSQLTSINNNLTNLQL